MKRPHLLLFSLLLLLTACAAAPAPAAPDSTPPAGAAAPADLPPYQMTVLYPGDITPRMESFIAGEFNQRMADELNLRVSISYSPWGEYFNKLDLMLSSGEPIDWYWDGASSFGKHLSKKHCIALDGLLADCGADVTRMIPQENWRATTNDGKIMAIPSQAMPQGDKFYTILARTDLMAEAGVTDFHTLEEFEDTMARISAKRSDVTMLSGPILQSLIRWYSPDDHIRIQNYVYVIENEEGSKAYSLFENKELMRAINNKMAEWVEKGWVPEKVLTERQNNVTRFDNGNYAFMDGAILRPQERLPSVRKNAPDAQLREFSLGDQPRYKELASNEFLFITPQCADPARVMMFFNWIYQSQDHFLFTLYGVEGKDYALNDDGSIERLSKDDLWYDWMFNNIQYAKFSSDVNPDFIGDLAHWEDNTVLSKLYGFTFDNTPVKSEVAQIDTIWTNKVYPLLDGFVDFDANYDDILSELRAAGIDRYAQEFARQLAAFRDGQ